MRGLSHRIRQTWLAAFSRSAVSIDPVLFPNRAVFELFIQLPIHDQRHLLAVYAKAVWIGLDPELCSAALLHDIGKVSLSGTGVSVVTRIVRVVLAARGDQANLNDETHRSGSAVTGLRLTRNHAVIGANRLRALGVKESVCQLVERHDELDSNDFRVRTLQEIDNSTP